MIKIPIKVLARYFRANTPGQQALLRDQKYPPPDLLTALRYHNRARSIIPALHRGDLSLEQVEATIATMRAEAKGANRFARAELISNAEILKNWIAHHAHRSLLLAGERVFELRRTDVEVTAKPNIVASEHADRRLIFFAFGTNVDAAHMRLLAELAFEVVSPWLPDLKLREIEVVDRFGNALALESRSPSLAGEIAIACNTISKVWPGINPPPGWTEGAGRGDGQLAINWHPQ